MRRNLVSIPLLSLFCRSYDLVGWLVGCDNSEKRKAFKKVKPALPTANDPVGVITAPNGVTITAPHNNTLSQHLITAPHFKSTMSGGVIV